MKKKMKKKKKMINCFFILFARPRESLRAKSETIQVVPEGGTREASTDASPW